MLAAARLAVDPTGVVAVLLFVALAAFGVATGFALAQKATAVALTAAGLAFLALAFLVS